MSVDLKLPSGVRWSGQLLLTIGLCLIAVVFVLRDGVPVLIAAVRPSADTAKVDVTTPLLKEHEKAQTLTRKRLEGRYLFAPPPPWVLKPKPAPPQPPPTAPVAPLPPPAPPVEYTGYKPIGMLGNTVFFEGGRSIELGKESEGITVVDIVSTWQLKLKHKEKVYDVTFGQKPNEDLFKPAPPRTSVPGISNAPPTGGAGSSGTATVAGGSGAARPTTAGSAAITAPGPKDGETPAAAGATPPAATPPAAAPGAAPAAAPSSLRTPPPPEGAAAPAPAAPSADKPGPTTAPAGGSESLSPPALTEEGVQAMTKEAARDALKLIAQAQGAGHLDEATVTRLKQEQQWLGRRLRSR